MSNNSCCCKAKVAAYTVGILGSFLVVAWLASLLLAKTGHGPVNEARGAERRKAAVDLAASNTEILNNYAVQDKAKGLIRLPIERAMALTVQEYKNPAAARSNLIVRVEKATFVPPKPPAKPSEFE